MSVAAEKESATDVGVGSVLLLGSAFLGAWALVLMWRWFIVPIGAPAIGYWNAMGVGLVSALLMHAPGRVRTGTTLERGVEAVLQPLVVLGVGALIHGLSS